MLSKWEVFEAAFLDRDIEVVCCTETWLCNDVPSTLLSVPGYELFRLDRSDKKNGGGVCTFVSEKCIVDNNTIIDLIITNAENVYYANTIQFHISDHCPVGFCKIVVKENKVRLSFSGRSYKN